MTRSLRRLIKLSIFIISIWTLLFNESIHAENTKSLENSKSVFDQLIAQAPNGEVPYPFGKLISFIEKITHGTAIEIINPLGRSLLRFATRPDFFEHPRNIVAFQSGSTQSQNSFGTLIKDRLFLGHIDGTNQIEVISYNEARGRPDFQVVHNYKDGARNQVFLAKEEKCIVCHKNQSAIMTPALWKEFNGNPIVEALLKKAHPSNQVQGASISQIPDGFGGRSSYAMDSSVRNANEINLLQQIWKEGCGSGDEGLRCRKVLLRIGFDQRLRISQESLKDSYKNEIAATDKILRKKQFIRPEPLVRDRDPFDIGVQTLVRQTLPINVRDQIIQSNCPGVGLDVFDDPTTLEEITILNMVQKFRFRPTRQNRFTQKGEPRFFQVLFADDPSPSLEVLEKQKSDLNQKIKQAKSPREIGAINVAIEQISEMILTLKGRLEFVSEDPFDKNSENSRFSEDKGSVENRRHLSAKELFTASKNIDLRFLDARIEKISHDLKKIPHNLQARIKVLFEDLYELREMRSRIAASNFRSETESRSPQLRDLKYALDSSFRPNTYFRNRMLITSDEESNLDFNTFSEIRKIQEIQNITTNFPIFRTGLNSKQAACVYTIGAITSDLDPRFNPKLDSSRPGIVEKRVSISTESVSSDLVDQLLSERDLALIKNEILIKKQKKEDQIGGMELIVPQDLILTATQAALKTEILKTKDNGSNFFFGEDGNSERKSISSQYFGTNTLFDCKLFPDDLIKCSFSFAGEKRSFEPKESPSPQVHFGLVAFSKKFGKFTPQKSYFVASDNKSGLRKVWSFCHLEQMSRFAAGLDHGELSQLICNPYDSIKLSRTINKISIRDPALSHNSFERPRIVASVLQALGAKSIPQRDQPINDSRLHREFESTDQALPSHMVRNRVLRNFINRCASCHSDGTDKSAALPFIHGNTEEEIWTNLLKTREKLIQALSSGDGSQSYMPPAGTQQNLNFEKDERRELIRALKTK